MTFVELYHSWVDTILLSTGLSDKTIHVNVGLAIFLSAQLTLRTRRGSLDALLVVVIAELANETMDRLSAGSWRWDDTLNDFVSTLAWPIVLVLAARYRRARWHAARLSIDGRARAAKLRGISDRPRWLATTTDASVPN